MIVDVISKNIIDIVHSFSKLFLIFVIVIILWKIYVNIDVSVIHYIDCL